nr:c-type cytochrome [Chitinophagaceae bacterium]
MKVKLLYIFCGIVLLVAFKMADDIPFVVPKYFPASVYDFKKNRLSSEKIVLGRVLFYDNLLSKNQTISCASCHSNYNAFAHTDHALSHGIYDSIGTRNAPALMNLAWQPIFMWDGAINHLDMQALAPIQNKIEMGEHIANVVSKLQKSPIYPKLFYKAFEDSIISGEHTLKALSAFMLTLVSCESKYDSVIKGYLAFDAKEKNGYALYKNHCSSCHTEPLFTNYRFENNGLALDTTLSDYGRMHITKQTNDSLKFKVPTLRNIEWTYPYMHDGRFKTLNTVLNHYSGGIIYSPSLSEPLQKPISLSAKEKVDLLSFLLTLSDTKYIFNKNHSFPREILKN